MSLEDIKSQVEGLGTAWEQFKATNDARLKEIEKKGGEDPLYKEQLDRISQSLDEHKSRMDQMHAALNRPAAPGTVEVKNAKEAEYKEAFSRYVRKGIVSPVLAPDHHMEGKALSVQSDPDGGYLVSPAMSSRINTVIFETSPIRQLATVETISTDSLDIMDDVNEAVAGWTSETGSVSETSTPQIGKRNIPVHELYAQPKATQKVIDDAERDVEAWLSGKIAEIFARKAVQVSIEREVAAGLFASARKIEGDAKKSILTGQKSGRVYVRRSVSHQASAPGEAPASDTGRLANSINGELVKGALESVVRAGGGIVRYARMLEFGTVRMAARPFFLPAIENNRKWIAERMKTAVSNGIKRGTRG